MELGKSWGLQKILIALFFVTLGLYFVVGLVPVRAAELEVATEIVIPKIGLTANVVLVTMEDGRLSTPDAMVGGAIRVPTIKHS